MVGHGGARVQKLASNQVFVRTKLLKEGERESIENALRTSVGIYPPGESLGWRVFPQKLPGAR